jgi:hypothetical protein
MNSRENRIRKELLDKRERLLEVMITAFPEVINMTGM